jgi:hypothetical protein
VLLAHRLSTLGDSLQNDGSAYSSPSQPLRFYVSTKTIVGQTGADISWLDILEDAWVDNDRPTLAAAEHLNSSARSMTKWIPDGELAGMTTPGRSRPEPP